MIKFSSLNPLVPLDAHALLLGLFLAAQILAQQSQLTIGVTATSYDYPDYNYDDIHHNDRSSSFNESTGQFDDEYTQRAGGVPKCGESSVEQQSKQRIFGGRPARPGEIPWQVNLKVKLRIGHARCGAVVVSDTTILTAAHCVLEAQCTKKLFGRKLRAIVARNFDARIGDLNQDNPDGEQRVGIKKVVLHEGYCRTQQSLYAHDIALLQTSTRMNFKITSTGYGSVNAICLPPSDRKYRDNQALKAAGWGHSDTRRLLVSQPRSRHRGGGGGGDYSSDSQPDPPATSGRTRGVASALLVTDLSLISTKRCKRLWDDNIIDQICASSYRKDTCQGDSGGPLYAYIGDNNRAELVGLVSFGPDRCASGRAPGVYTNVHSHLAWIRANSS